MAETRRDELQQPYDTALFQSDFPLPIQHPPQKKIKMYFMKVLYMKHLLAVIKWTIWIYYVFRTLACSGLEQDD